MVTRAMPGFWVGCHKVLDVCVRSWGRRVSRAHTSRASWMEQSEKVRGRMGPTMQLTAETQRQKVMVSGQRRSPWWAAVGHVSKKDY